MSKIQKALGKIHTTDRNRPLARGNGVLQKNGASHLPGLGGDNDLPTVTLGPQISVDFEALRKEGLVPPPEHERQLAEQYREIKHPLIANAYGKRVTVVEDGRLIGVTSALPGEGKTFTSINLALSIAQERDHSVLLIDADVAKPHISAAFGLEGKPGLLDLLDDHSLHPGDIVTRTDIPGFSLLPAGAPRHHAMELLSSRRMEDVIRMICDADDRRVLVFDTPPLFRTTEAKVITGLMGQVVVVVKADSTPQGAVISAVHMLSQDQAVNLVLNQSKYNKTDHGYGYGYQYKYPAQALSPTVAGAEVQAAANEPAPARRGLWD